MHVDKPRPVVMADRGRFVVLIIWLASFMLAFSGVEWLTVTDRIGPESFASLIAQLQAMYKPFLLVILGFYTGTRFVRPVPPQVAAAFGVCTALLWNLWILFFIGCIVAGRCWVETAVGSMHTAAGALEWIVGPALGLYFGSRR